MNVLIKQELAISVLLFIFLFIVTWPLYKYVFDVDGMQALKSHCIPAMMTIKPYDNYKVIPNVLLHNELTVFKLL
jgi:hypothetical protein